MSHERFFLPGRYALPDAEPITHFVREPMTVLVSALPGTTLAVTSAGENTCDMTVDAEGYAVSLLLLPGLALGSDHWIVGVPALSQEMQVAWPNGERWDHIATQHGIEYVDNAPVWETVDHVAGELPNTEQQEAA